MASTVLYPHKTMSGDLILTLDHVYLDDQILASDKIQYPFSIADIGRTGQEDWQCAKLTWTLRHEPENNDETVFDFTAQNGELRAWLAFECRPTNLRISLKLLPSDQPDLWKGTLLIDRENVAASAKVQAWLAYNLDGGGIENKSRVAAESNSWVIYLDPPRSFQRDGGMQMTWIDFSKYDELDWIKDYQAAFSAIDLSPETPRILLNSSIPGFQDLLTDEKAGDPAHETLRTMAANNVARGAWMALAHQSIRSLRKSGGVLEEWSAPAWQREVMQILALILGPNLKLSDWLENDGADWIREGLSPANWTRLDVALGDWLAKRSNLAVNWQKWSKSQTKSEVASTVTATDTTNDGILKRLKNKLSRPTKSDQQTAQLWSGSDE
jgi:hypothetical protein